MKPEIKATIEYIVTHFSKELYYYTVEGVKDTAHVPPGSSRKPDNWTTYLLEYLEEMGELSPSLADLKASLTFQNKKLIELERTFTAIHCYHLCQEGNYAAFIETQEDLTDKLTLENFSALGQITQSIAPDTDSQAVLEALIIFSDLGKSPETRELAEMEGIDATLDTDDLMLAILQLPEDKIGKIIPRYKHLNESAKQMLKEAYPFMTICFGHLFFLEGNAKTLEDIERVLRNMSPSIALERRQQLLNLVFAAQFFDANGAQGQKFMYGSRTCTNDFYRGYIFMLETMQKLHHQSAAVVSEAYRTQRAEWMGLSINQFEKKEDFDVVLRLGCTLRLFNTETDRATAQAFKIAFYSLPPAHQQLLSKELNFNSLDGLNQFAHSPNYIATGGQNICRNNPGTPLSSEDIQNVLNYTIVLARLIKKLRTEYTAVIQDPVLPLNFGGVAALANGDKGPDNVANPDSVDLDALLAAEPILPKATMERLEQPVKEAAIQTKWTNRPLPNGTIKNLIFDLGHVFVRIDTSRITVFEAFSQLAKEQGKNLSTVDIQQIFTSTKLDQIVEGTEMSSVDKIVVDFHRGKTTKNQFRRAITKALSLDPVSNAEFDRAWTASILGTKKEVAERLAYLEQLRDKGYNIFLLSNNNKIHRLHTKTHYEGNHWQDKFMRQYYSDDTGNYKPDTEAFEQILRENNLQPEQTLFFDDSLKYVQKAHELGIHARQFTVNRMVNDVSLAIRAANKVDTLNETHVDKLLSSSMDSVQLEEQYTKPEERKRAASLMAFTFLKFKENAERKKQEREEVSSSVQATSVKIK